MNKLSFCLFLCCVCINAQNTYYYNQIRIVDNNSTSVSGQGGQFITFVDNICYESNNKGLPVGNGTLKYDLSQKDKDILIYCGNSYWGKNAVFKFTSDLATLNVVTENGDVYLYKRTTAPANVTTCSLIRKNSSSSSSFGEISGGSYPNVPSQPVFNGGGATSTTPIKTTPERNTPTRVWHECGLCHGKRTIVRESSVPTYGQDTQWYCNQCGRNVWRSSGHSHVTCSQCHGQGGYYTTQ